MPSDPSDPMSASFPTRRSERTRSNSFGASNTTPASRVPDKTAARPPKPSVTKSLGALRLDDVEDANPKAAARKRALERSLAEQKLPDNDAKLEQLKRAVKSSKGSSATIEVLDSLSQLRFYQDRAQVLDELRPVLRLLISKMTNFKFYHNDKWVQPYARSYVYGGESFYAWWEEQQTKAVRPASRPPFRRPLDFDVWVPIQVESWEEQEKLHLKQNLFVNDLTEIWNSGEMKAMWSSALERLTESGRTISDPVLSLKQSALHYSSSKAPENPTWAANENGIYMEYSNPRLEPQDVRHAFSAFGDIQRVYFRRNKMGRTAGYACVFYKQQEDFQRALRQGTVTIHGERISFKAKGSNAKKQRGQTINNSRMYITVTMEYYEGGEEEPVPLIEFQLRPRAAWGQHFKRASTLLLRPPTYTVIEHIGQSRSSSSLEMQPQQDGLPTIRVLSVKDTYKACNVALEKRSEKIKSRTDIQRIMWFCKHFDALAQPERVRRSSIFDVVNSRLEKQGVGSVFAPPAQGLGSKANYGWKQAKSEETNAQVMKQHAKERRGRNYDQFTQTE